MSCSSSPSCSSTETEVASKSATSLSFVERCVADKDFFMQQLDSVTRRLLPANPSAEPATVMSLASPVCNAPSSLPSHALSAPYIHPDRFQHAAFDSLSNSTRDHVYSHREPDRHLYGRHGLYHYHPNHYNDRPRAYPNRHQHQLPPANCRVSYQLHQPPSYHHNRSFIWTNKDPSGFSSKGVKRAAASNHSLH